MNEDKWEIEIINKHADNLIEIIEKNSNMSKLAIIELLLELSEVPIEYFINLRNLEIMKKNIQNF